MKKILSLLSMLMITVMAFATDYKGQLDYAIKIYSNSYPVSIAEGTLSITQYDNGNYQVTAKDCNIPGVGDFGNVVCDGLSGTTDANGVTTIDVSDCTAGLDASSGWTDLSSTKLLVKFKGDKAYATFEGKYQVGVWRTVSYTFGTDDFGSTGGGETGGETSSVVTVLENYTNDGNRFSHSFKIDWDKQKVVMSIDPTPCGNDLEHIVGLGVDCTQWNYALHVYNKYFGVYEGNSYNKQMLQAYFQTTSSNNNTGVIDRKSPFSVEVSKEKGFAIDGEVKISASKMADLFTHADLTVGSGQGGDAASHAKYNYIKVVPLDWTEVPPVTVDKTFTYDQDAYVGTNNTNGTANVKVNKMTDDTYTMEITAPVATKVGEISVGTDAKGRTTYMGEVESAVVSGVKYVVHGVVYTAEDGAKHLYMTLTNDDVTYTIGKDPDYVAPVTYKNTLYVVENAKLLLETPEAEVVLQDKGDNKYDVTLPAFTADGKEVPSITFEATKADNKLTASNVTVANVYNGEAAVVTMDGTFEADNKLVASLTVKCGELFDYEVGYGIKPFVATTQEFTAEWANVKVGDAEPVNFQNAKADYTEFAKGQYSLTFKDLTFGEKKIGDFTIKYVNKDAYGELSTTASAGEWTRVETDQEVASKGDMPAISGFEGRLGGTCVLIVKFTIAVGGTTGNVAVDFGNKYEAPKTPDPVDVVEEGFKATGESWKKEGVAIDWDTQYIAAKLDLSTCKTSSSPENVLAVGTDITGWNDGPHYFFYYNKADKVLQYNYLHKANSSYNSGFANLSKAYIQLSDEVVTIEISKQGGLKINGESALVKYVNTAKDPSTNSSESWTTEDLPTVFSGLWALNTIDFGGCQGTTMSNATYKYVKVVPLGWTEPVTPPSVKDQKTFNEALYMVQGTTSTKVADAKVVVKEMSDNTVNMSLQFNGNEYTSTELVKGTDEKNRTTYTGKVSKDTQTFDVAGVVYEKETADRLYMTMTAAGVTFVVGENPDAVTPDVTEVSNKTYTSNLRILDGEEPVVENAEAQVNIIKYSDDSYKVTLKNVNMLNKTQDLVFVGKVITDVTDSEAPLTIMAKSDEATTTVFGEEMSATFEITEVSAEEIKMAFSMESQNFSYMGEFNYTEEEVEEPEVYTSNLHIYDAAAPETDLFQADQAKVEFLATATGEFKLTLKDVTLNEKTQDLVFTGTLPAPEPGGQEQLAEEGETTPAEPAMVLNATADEATTDFFGGGATYATAVFNVSYDKNDNFMMTFTIAAAGKNYAGEFNYVKKTPETPDPELFCKENYVADGEGFEWEINVDWDTQKIVMSIDPSTCTGSCEDVIGLGAVPTAWNNTLHLYRTSADQMLQGYFQTSADNNNTGKFAETTPFLVEVSKAQGFVVNNEVKIAASAMSDLFTLSTVKMGTGEGANDKSRATYNYVKVVDKDWTAPKDPDTGINATTVAEGEVEFFTVNGVKLNKLQKGLNIVRTADGKVKKVLVK